MESHGRPLACVIVPANVHDAMVYHSTVTAFSIPRPIGRPITRPKEILADAAYDTKAIRTENRRRGITIMIPVNRRIRKMPKRGGRFGLTISGMAGGPPWNGSSAGSKRVGKLRHATKGKRYHTEDWLLSPVFSSSGGFWDRLMDSLTGILFLTAAPVMAGATTNNDSARTSAARRHME